MCRVCVCAFSCVYPVSASADTCVSQYTSGQKTASGLSPHFAPWFRRSFVYHWVQQASWPLSFWEFCLWAPPPPFSRNFGVADACCDIQCTSHTCAASTFSPIYHPKLLSHCYLCIWLILSSFRWAINYWREFANPRSICLLCGRWSGGTREEGSFLRLRGPWNTWELQSTPNSVSYLTTVNSQCREAEDSRELAYKAINGAFRIPQVQFFPTKIPCKY